MADNTSISPSLSTTTTSAVNPPLSAKLPAPAKGDLQKKIATLLQEGVDDFLNKVAEFEKQFIIKPSLHKEDSFKKKLKALEDEVKKFNNANEKNLNKDQEKLTDYVLEKIGIIEG